MIVDAVCSEVEEEVSIVVCGQRLTCFASYLPYQLEAGGIYRAELLPIIFNEYVVHEVSYVEPNIVREGVEYSYSVTGELKDGCLYCGGLVFCDEILLADFSFLEGKSVSWKIDRLDISFVE